MQKRIFARALSLALVLLLLMPGGVALAANAPMPGDLAGAKAAVLMEQVGGQSVASYQAEEKMEVGGLSRLPALLVVCEAMDAGILEPSASITVSEEAARIKGPTAFLSAYEVIDAASLMKAAVMITAGDAIYALSEAAYGSATACIQHMQTRLFELGVDAVYADLMGAEVRLSANELACLGRALMNSPAFTAYSNLFFDGISHADGRTTELASANKLLKTSVGCTGVATGSSATAGYCGVFSVSRGGTAWLCTVIGAPNASARFAAAGDLIDYGFAAYEVKNLARVEEVLVDAMPVLGARRSTVALIAGKEAVLLMPRGTGHEAQWDLPEALTAPLSSSESVGTVRYLDDTGAEICSVELFPAEDIPQAGVVDYAVIVLSGWVHG
ncbi:MAG: hypothetical protein VB049_04690 [Candidatus Pelethousia sp.]|nr:hypothetical protein [Candidatus Pelethousia sp.]